MTTLIDDVTVIGGVDTHKHTHYAAVIDDHGGWSATRSSTPPLGYATSHSWMRGYGHLASIGVESTGSFGAALARELTHQGEHVIEVNRPNRIARRMDGKSDRLDAEQIARAVLGETSTAIPKSKSWTIEVIRTLRVTHSSAVKARTQAFHTLFGIMICVPSTLRDELVDLTKRTLVHNRDYTWRQPTGHLREGGFGLCLPRGVGTAFVIVFAIEGGKSEGYGWIVSACSIAVVNALLLPWIVTVTLTLPAPYGMPWQRFSYPAFRRPKLARPGSSSRRFRPSFRPE